MNQAPDNLVARALKILTGTHRTPPVPNIGDVVMVRTDLERKAMQIPDVTKDEPVIIEPAAPHARPVYWERQSTGDILGPALPEFLAMVGRGESASYWVVALYESLPIWIHVNQLRSKQAFETQVRLKPVEWIREPR